MASGNKFRSIFNIIALFLMVIALPALSWYYLKRGFDDRIATMEEIKDFGKIPAFSLSTASGETINEGDLERNVVVASFLSTEHPELRSIYGKRLNKLQDQFNDRDRVMFAIHQIGDTVNAENRLSQFAQAYELNDKPAVLLLNDGDQLATSAYKLPLEPNIKLEDNPYLVLVDTTLTIRNYYDVRAEEEMRKLVHHLTMILPPKPRKDIYFKREKEK